MAVAAPPENERTLEVDGTANLADTEREYAIAGLKRKRKFAQDAGAYVAINGLLWVIWLISDGSANGGVPWPAWVSIAWGFFLALDGWRAYASWPASASKPITETEIQREIERTRRR